MGMARGALPTRIDGCDNGDPDEDHCEGCDGSGIRAPAGPTCMLPTWPLGWCFVERCDYCERYPDDRSAALAVSPEVQLIKCAAAGVHAIAHIGAADVQVSSSAGVLRCRSSTANVRWYTRTSRVRFHWRSKRRSCAGGNENSSIQRLQDVRPPKHSTRLNAMSRHFCPPA
jgi:hypothetical protein